MAREIPKQRSSWEERERLQAVKLVIQDYSLLYGGFSDGVTHKDKSAAWEKVANDLNASSSTKKTAAEVKKLFQNVKSRAKRKYSDKLATGGGPVTRLSPAEEVVLDFLKDKPQLVGVPGGIESGVEPVENTSVADEVKQKDPLKEITLPQDQHQQQVQSEPAQQENCPPPQSSSKKRRKRCSDRIELTEELHSLEVSRAKKEIELLDLKIAHQKELFEMKKKILQKAISNPNMDINIAFSDN